MRIMWEGHLYHSVGRVGGSEDNSVELFLPFHIYVGSGIELEPIDLHNKCFHLLIHLTSPLLHILIFKNLRC